MLTIFLLIYTVFYQTIVLLGSVKQSAPYNINPFSIIYTQIFFAFSKLDVGMGVASLIISGIN